MPPRDEKGATSLCKRVRMVYHGEFRSLIDNTFRDGYILWDDRPLTQRVKWRDTQNEQEGIRERKYDSKVRKC